MENFCLARVCSSNGFLDLNLLAREYHLLGVANNHLVGNYDFGWIFYDFSSGREFVRKCEDRNLVSSVSIEGLNLLEMDNN